MTPSDREALQALPDEQVDIAFELTERAYEENDYIAVSRDWFEAGARWALANRAALPSAQAAPEPPSTPAELESLRKDAAKSERRAITFGDCLHHQILAMRAAVVAGHLESPAHGMQWIVNTLAGPGHLPDLDEARALGGAQGLFDKEMAEHEAFRAAHPAPSRAEPAEKYDDVLAPFIALMRKELHANSGKGDRPGWLSMSRQTAMLEIWHHAAKLQKAALNDDRAAIREHAADVANMSMMLLDVCGGLDALAEPSRVAEPRDAHRGGDSYEASMLRNLLARIHRDGGHYVEEHGLDKAIEDADARVVEWLGLQDKVGRAYGYLWCSNNEPGTPNQYPPQRAAYEARKLLRDTMTHDERGRYINEVLPLVRGKDEQ